MRYLASYLTPAGALVMLVCFFLPWIVIECHTRETPDLPITISGQEVVEFSGLDLARSRSLYWGIPVAAVLILLFAVSRLPARWRYRFCLVSGVAALVLLAISYENFQRVDQEHFIALLQEGEEARKILGDLPPDLRETIQDALDQVKRWNRHTGVEVSVDFRQAYSLMWAGCALSVLASLVMLLRLARARR